MLELKSMLESTLLWSYVVGFVSWCFFGLELSLGLELLLLVDGFSAFVLRCFGFSSVRIGLLFSAPSSLEAFCLCVDCFRFGWGLSALSLRLVF